MTGQPVSVHTALVYLMILVAGSDGRMGTPEMQVIGRLVREWPVFESFNVELLIPLSRDCGTILNTDDGLDTVLGLLQTAIPDELGETAYCLACEVAAADGEVDQDERHMLDTIRARLGLERLAAAAIERATAARLKRLPS
ncbi:tellurite resistance TerB family protein [Pedomonas sp. V897]|mgnify:CR=1 FL=1|uniref:tellurite resistance TerB family protein n=1 Tax=Pedomonas sp. V897 TaxID=3446482 RepID=UPI003EE0026B